MNGRENTVSEDADVNNMKGVLFGNRQLRKMQTYAGNLLTKTLESVRQPRIDCKRTYTSSPKEPSVSDLDLGIVVSASDVNSFSDMLDKSHDTLPADSSLATTVRTRIDNFKGYPSAASGLGNVDHQLEVNCP
ncbi:hypothetical protein HKX48_003564 [Thoreauomyces humboldtii]|nr:hypothetical protein HKX48_003564 [Thoreauomyces humboldtii]